MLSKSGWMDVDGDGKKDRVFYRIQRWKDDFEGLLTITNEKQKVLWEHEFFMGANDLAKFLDEVLGYDSVKVWVSSVFNNKADYSFRSEKLKIKEEEIDEKQLEHSAKIHNMSGKKLRAEILSSRTNRVFTYRAEWREDLMKLVYVPSLQEFVCFSRGY